METAVGIHNESEYNEILQQAVVVLCMATLYKILILYVGFALSCNLWARSRVNVFYRKGDML